MHSKRYSKGDWRDLSRLVVSAPKAGSTKQLETLGKWMTSHSFDFRDVRKTSFIRGLSVTPLAEAARLGDLPICKLLYEHGAENDVNQTSRNRGWTPMMLACVGGHLQVAKWLMSVGAGPSVCLADSDGCTPLFWACREGHLDVVAWLLLDSATEDIEGGGGGGGGGGARGDLQRPNPIGHTPFYAACQLGRLEVAEFLVVQGALNSNNVNNVNSVNNEKLGSYSATFSSTCTKSHVDKERVQSEVYRHREMRHHLSVWAREQKRALLLFQRTVLVGALGKRDPRRSSTTTTSSLSSAAPLCSSRPPPPLSTTAAASSSSSFFPGAWVSSSTLHEADAQRLANRRAYAEAVKRDAQQQRQQQAQALLKPSGKSSQYSPPLYGGGCLGTLGSMGVSAASSSQPLASSKPQPVNKSALSSLQGKPALLQLVACFAGILHGKGLRNASELLSILNSK
jgi:hypothetical protein